MKILIAGDVFATEHTEKHFARGDAEKTFGNLKKVFEGNDINFVNLECAIGSSTNAIKKYGPNLISTYGTAQTLKNLGVTLCGLSNNHSFDFGIEGMQSTLSELSKAGLEYTGFGENYEDSRKNYVYEKDGEKVCIIAVCEHEYTYALDNRMGSRPFDPFDTIWDIREAKKECDRVIVIYHGGKELSRYPSPRVRKTFHAMAKNGADVVIGQHSHCLCGYEKVNGAHLFYGQGDFNFVRKHEGLHELRNCSMLFKYDTKTNEAEFIPTVQAIEYEGTKLAEGEDKEAVEKIFREASNTLSDGTWIDKWKEFAKEAQGEYLRLLKIAYSDEATDIQKCVLGHYVDCEAHEDILREMYPSFNLTNK